MEPVEVTTVLFIERAETSVRINSGTYPQHHESVVGKF